MDPIKDPSVIIQSDTCGLWDGFKNCITEPLMIDLQNHHLPCVMIIAFSCSPSSVTHLKVNLSVPPSPPISVLCVPTLTCRSESIPAVLIIILHEQLPLR